ncbi:MAG: dynamin family protein [Proteobacteria bacterium]|nr:dynamin family protein [Pseudomonadota bacterium]
MPSDQSPETLTKAIEKHLNSKLKSSFAKYDQSIDDLTTPLKWKPLVLVIGNFSSGKSTFINELLGMDVQRTGQSPTDDSFTILAHPDDSPTNEDMPGRSVVADNRLPFMPIRVFGESLLSHIKLKCIDSPILKNLAIIDTPGMLDSVTEKDRGYDYLGVVGELSRLSDLVILMFDPHKAGTIKETYKAIRSTLPGSTGEDRVLYVLNRIDECENTTDLVKSFGTLCWNLSQMTGRKDIPRIYLTFSPGMRETHKDFETYTNEREELKSAVLNAPKMRIDHIFEEVDRGVREQGLLVEALEAFQSVFFSKIQNLLQYGFLAVIILFFCTDVLLNLFTEFPESTLIANILNGSVTLENFLIPTISSALVIFLVSIIIRRFIYPKHLITTIHDIDNLLALETSYKKDLWDRVRGRILTILDNTPTKHLFKNHRSTLKKIKRFTTKDLPEFSKRFRS